MRRFLLALLLAVAASGAGAAPARALLPADAVARLNQQRERHGLPAGLVEEPAWSQGCRDHAAYQQRNGAKLAFDEVPGRPGFTELGAWVARNELLARNRPWPPWTLDTPWEDSPADLHRLLHARLSRVGVDALPGFACVTLAGTDRPPPPSLVTYSYPGPGTVHRHREEVDGVTSGPHLYVLVDAPEGARSARVVAAQVTGPDGPVDVRTVDGTTPGIGERIPAGAQVVPVRPLAPLTTYEARVDLEVTLGSGAVVPASRMWSFSTQAPLPGRLVPGGAPSLRGRVLRVPVRCTGGPCDAQVRARWRGGGAAARRVRLRRGERRTVRLRAGRAGLTVSVAGARVPAPR